MAKANWNEYSATPGSNTVVDDVNIAEGCPPSGINNAVRELMAHTADVVAGTVALSSINIDGGSITGITDLAVADGGTGGSTASAARSNLGAAALGSNSDITALTGLTTDLNVAQGGTGASTFAANGVLFGNGTSAVGATAVGTDGHVLTSNGSGSAPTFQAAGGGKLLQVVQGTYAGSAETTTSTSFSNTSLTVNITPTATTSKFLVTCAANMGGYRTSDTNVYSAPIRFKESAVTNDVYPSTTHGFSYSFSDDNSTGNHYLDLAGVAASWLHAPSLSNLNALTYVLQFKTLAGQGRHNFSGSNGTSIITVMEIGA